MKGLFKAPRSRRVSYEFRHGARASVWHEISVRSHLVVAAVGTIVFLGMAGTAIWLALPSNRTTVLARASDTAKPPVQAKAASVVATTPEPAEVSRAPVQNAEELRAQTAGSSTAEASAVARLDGPEQSDARSVVSAGDSAKAALEAAAGIVADNAASDIVANAYAEDDGAGTADKAATAAIPAKRPNAPKADASVKKATQTADGSRGGRTLRAVTMRAQPSSRGGVLGTVPGQADVDVISCSSWCEIVYQGKRGFVYKGFLRNGGR